MPQITVGSGGVNRKVKQLTVGVGGASRKVKEGWAGVSGVNRKVFSSGVGIGTLPTGSKVNITISGTPYPFLVVHQGLPSSVYDASCNGTWLLMKDIYEERQWHKTHVNQYAKSDIHSYLNSGFYNAIDLNVKPAIRQVKVPYYPMDYSTPMVRTGSDGLSSKIFLLSAYEVGWSNSDVTSLYPDGGKLAYFLAGSATDANSKRIGRLNGTAAGWWLRTPVTVAFTNAFLVNTTGAWYNNGAGNSRGIRPAFILPSAQLVSDTPDGSGAYNLQF